ncbi:MULTISPECIES: hypothetical protein [unclassified Duganella]|uniref:hypothetical protein n=1 Tax=unclassified Duganella TaxID=2636909 RepID=UPI0011C0F0C4|nr:MULTISPECIES: hypothetical protein [unclassified Duganella]
MNFAEFSQLLEDDFDFGFDPSLTISDFQGKCAVNDLVALRLTSVSPKYAPGDVVPISDGIRVFADLVNCEGQEFGYGMASAQFVASYLEEASAQVMQVDGDAKRDQVFSHSYLVVNIADFADYLTRYREGSAIWGSFVHSDEQPNRIVAHLSNSALIIAKPNLSLSNSIVKDTAFRAVVYASPLERFLKLYHLLEIDFDVQIVSAINALGTDLKGIGKLLKSFGNDKEFERLLKIVRKASPVNSGFFEDILRAAFSKFQYHPQLAEMLIEYTKESNPYKLESARFLTAVAAGYDAATWSGNGMGTSYDNLSKFVAYIIYRFRCSIAHVKIGEYLLTTDDETFIYEVAEPMIVTILSEVYKR